MGEEAVFEAERLSGEVIASGGEFLHTVGHVTTRARSYFKRKVGAALRARRRVSVVVNAALSDRQRVPPQSAAAKTPINRALAISHLAERYGTKPRK